jgi:hypothetical protein
LTLQPHLRGTFPAADGWIDMLDGNDECREIFDRHYSRYIYADGREPKLFVGPGEKMVLLDANGPGLFVWRKFVSKDGQDGINCAIFRNETRERSSDMILTAMKRAFERWLPHIVLFEAVHWDKLGDRVHSKDALCMFLKGARLKLKGSKYKIESVRGIGYRGVILSSPIPLMSERVANGH